MVEGPAMGDGLSSTWLYNRVRVSIGAARALIGKAYECGPGQRSDRSHHLLLAVRQFNEATKWRDLARARRKQETP